MRGGSPYISEERLVFLALSVTGIQARTKDRKYPQKCSFTTKT